MRSRDWFRSPHHILTIFLGIAVVFGAALGWLGWMLFQQDKTVETQRRRERLDDAADRAVAVMQRSIAELQSQLDPRTTPANPPAGVTILFAGSRGIDTRPATGFLYYSDFLLVTGGEAPPETFADAEKLEFAGHKPAAAAQSYEKLARVSNPAVRAGALTRLARIRRRQNDSKGAEAAYRDLEQIPNAAVGGIPAGVIAREGIASLFQEKGRTQELMSEAVAFQSDLINSRWRLTKQQYEFYASETAAWLGKPVPVDEDAVAKAEALQWLSQSVSGSQLIQAGQSPALVISSRTAGGLQAAIGGPKFLATLCREAVPGAGLQCAIANLEGRILVGQSPPARDAAVRTAAATRLPLTLHVFADSGGPAVSLRRQLLIWVFAVLGIVLLTGTFFIVHAISSELRVARLQSDFVAAVSHEFRTPLSTLSQISEMLAHDRFSGDDQRRKSFDVLTRETERLRRLVEGLLDFGRFEAGAAVYRFETIDAGPFLSAIAGEFQERVAAQGYVVEINVPDGALPIRADREALARAVWNLLDNAVKYSPECRTVWVDVERQGDHISIAVRDHGLGIPAHEQREIFNKFVRGEDSKTRRIKGTGIGLAMVRHIVQAHGGEILLASEPGQGSRFTLLLRAVGGVS
jgi:signal transduction histidine kinase